ncbi:MAG: haloacid dehalogenase type II [Acidiferrobacterales bacterium]
MQLSDFDALTFDCYGTLIDWERGILGELRPWVEQHGLTLGDEVILAAFAELEPKHQAETPDKLYPDVLASVYHDLGVQWEIPITDEDASTFAKSIARWPAFDDSAPSLQYLKRHYKLVILSNVDRASFAESNKKLGVTFDKIITAQDVGSYKPDPRNFEYAISALAEIGVAKNKILHCGQSLFHDVVPGRAVGLATMWVNRSKGRTSATREPTKPVRPDFEVVSLAEFVNKHQAELGA